MKQMTFADAEYASKRKQTRRHFLAEMEQVMPWAGLLALIKPYYPRLATVARRTRWKPCCASICCKTLSVPQRFKALYEITSLRQFTQLSLTHGSTQTTRGS